MEIVGSLPGPNGTTSPALSQARSARSRQDADEHCEVGDVEPRAPAVDGAGRRVGHLRHRGTPAGALSRPRLASRWFGRAHCPDSIVWPVEASRCRGTAGPLVAVAPSAGHDSHVARPVLSIAMQLIVLSPDAPPKEVPRGPIAVDTSDATTLTWVDLDRTETPELPRLLTGISTFHSPGNCLTLRRRLTFWSEATSGGYRSSACVRPRTGRISRTSTSSSVRGCS